MQSTSPFTSACLAVPVTVADPFCQVPEPSSARGPPPAGRGRRRLRRVQRRKVGS